MLNPSSEMISRMEKLLERVQEQKETTADVVVISQRAKSEKTVTKQAGVAAK